MENCKYVVVDTDEGGPAAFLFPPFISHADFVRRLGVSTKSVHSAGFVRMVDGRPRACGEAVSLQKGADPDWDNVLLERLLPPK